MRDIENDEEKREADADEGEGEDKSETGNEITDAKIGAETGARIMCRGSGYDPLATNHGPLRTSISMPSNH